MINYAFRFVLLVSCAAMLSVDGATLAPAIAQEAAGKTGNVKGKVRADDGTGVAGATVTARRGEQDVASTTTNGKGDFRIDLPAGTYTLVFRKPGLRVGTMQDIEVAAGKSRSLRDRLILPVDEGSLAFVRGSVFDPGGRSVPGARIELARIAPDGSARRVAERLSDATGSFAFRVAPEPANYRVTVRRAGAETATKDVEVEGAIVYRIALTLNPRAEN